MFYRRFLGALALLLAVTASIAQTHSLTTSTQAFSENKGQWNSEARFRAKIPGLNLWVTGQGMVMDFYKFVPNPNQKRDFSNPRWQPKGTLYGDVVRMSLVNARNTAVSGVGRLTGYENYFLGNKPTRWASRVHRFSEARAEQPYPGIGLRYYFDQSSPRYDILANPGADLSQVGFKVEGVLGMQVVPSGDLELKTAYGSITEKGLRAYQESAGIIHEVPCRMVVDKDILRFDLGAYDSTKAVVIDPLVFSTYFGGSGGDSISGMKRDSANNLVIAGTTYSSDLPTSTGAYQKTNAGVSNGVTNVFISKLDPTGKTQLSSTFLGGTGIGAGAGLGDNDSGFALDGSNNAVVAGTTYSGDFPTTTGAFQSLNPEYVSASYFSTCFVAKVSANGATLMASSYLGGSGKTLFPPAGTGDAANGVTVDASGNPIVVGTAQNPDFPISSTAFQKTLSDTGCFVTKLSADGKTLLGSTFLAGSARDYGQAVAVDATQNMVVTGTAYSTDFPVTAGVYQSTNRSLNNGANGFISKVSADCSHLLLSTYFGGTTGPFSQARDMPTAIALDGAGNFWVAGTTGTTDFPTTNTAFQRSFGELDGIAYQTGFLAKVSANATTLMASTYLGGTNGAHAGDGVLGLVVDGSGNPVVCGTTDANDFPITPGAFQTTNGGYSLMFNTAFVSKLTADGSRLLASTYLGGNGGDSASGVALDSSGNPVVAGTTGSTNFPVTAGVYRTTAPGTGDTFVTDLAFPIVSLVVAPTSVAGGLTSTGSVTLPIPAGGSGVVVTLSSNNAAAHVPASVTVPAGSSWATFTITTIPVSSNVTATITAVDGAYSQSSTLAIVLPSLASATFSPTSVVGGNPGTGTVTLATPAGPSGVIVTLTGTGPWTLPASVTVPANATSATFAPTTNGVNVSTTATVNAKFGAVTKSATLTVAPATIATFTASASSLVGGSTEIATITLNGKGGPLGDTAFFTSTGPALAPTPLNLSYGVSTASQRIITSPVSTAATATVTAKMGTTSKTISFTVTPALISAVTLPASTLGGNTATCTISLSAAAGPTGDVVTLTGTGPWVVPASVTVPAGKTSVSFTATTTAVSASTTAHLSATLGASTLSGTMTVAEASVSYIVLLPTSVVGGSSVFVIVSLNGPAGPTGDVVSLSGAGPWTLPASVTVPAGNTGAFFSMTTKTVTSSTTGTVKATLGASSASATLTVTP